ncbi:MAG: lipoprotein-releasing system ATP-binding protein [Flavobacteriales bacterium]|jgi:lipoprotein-releasing system ATP-binding protein
MIAISANGIYKSYGDVSVLKGIDVEIPENKVVAIVGASGAGKTTLLQVLSTLEKPDAGEVSVYNTNLSNLKGKQLAKFRNQEIGFVFQFHQLFPEFTAFENVCIPGYLSPKSKKEVEKRAHELLDMLGLQDRKQHKPDELSGGEKQRVAVARALINNPKVVFADEPSGNLDSNNAESLHQLFFDIKKQLSCTFVIVTHNLELAKLADICLTMKDGMIVPQ